MAQGAVVSIMAGKSAQAGGSGDLSSAKPLISDGLHELQQYQKILRFRDEVVNGMHPRIKPTHLGKPASSTPANPSAPASAQATIAKPSLNGGRQMADNVQAYQANLQRPPPNPPTSFPGLGNLKGASGPSRPYASGKPEIDPVLLEKSDDLKKAEMHLHRQRVERGLRDQIEQRRASHKASTQSEQLADFDVAEVMTKALALVQSTSAQPTDDTAANASASSDSFDDNTFYSSQHDTPSSRNVSRLHNDSESDEMRDGSPYEPALEPDPAPAPPPQPPTAPQSLLQNVLYQQHLGSSTPGSTAALSQYANIVPGLSSEAISSSYPYRHFLPPEVVSSQGSGPVSRSESGNTTKENTVDSRDLARINERLANVVGQRESPLVRAHDLSPIAPQPAHVSPLAIARQPALAQSDIDVRRGTPAQVAALRKQHSAATSPDSSPQGSRAADRKKGKKKKRKADKMAAQNNGGSPFIKPEPRSPSPIAAPAFSRPNKRQRQLHQQPSEISYGDAMYDQPPAVDHGYQDRYQARVRREERVVGYERVDETGRREVEPILIESPRYERVYYDEPRSANSVRQGLPESPHVYETSYPPREMRPVRPVSRVIEPGSGEPAYYHDGRPSSRTGMRPPTYRIRSQSPVAHERTTSAMLPPRTVAARIVVDAYGNEYFEPPRSATVLRDDYRQVDPGRVYEPAQPPHAVSRRPDIYEDDATLYARTSPYAVRRRVVTQPEFLPQEQRVYREVGQAIPPATGEYIARSRADSRSTLEPGREYIARPSGARPMVDPAQYDGAPTYERRPVEERSYVDPRAASVRPPDAVRYEVPVAYERRVGDGAMPSYPSIRSASVRPAETVRYEMARDYGSRVGSVRPPDLASHVMHPPPVVRSYSVMPSEVPQAVRRDFNGQAHPRYYGRPPVPGDDEVIFLDRQPRDPHRELR